MAEPTFGKTINEEIAVDPQEIHEAVFTEIARTGSFGAAARRLLMATPSVSARITRLESKLGTSVFIRTSRGSQLTASGRTFLSYAQRALSILEEAHHAVLSDPLRRAVVAVPASLGAVVYPSILDIWATASITGDCRVAHSKEVIEIVLDGTAAVGLVINMPIPSSLIAHNVCRSPLYAVASSEHPLAISEERPSLDDVLGYGVAIYRWGPEAATLAAAFDKTLSTSNPAVHLIGLPSTVLDLVNTSHYVGIVPEFSAKEGLRSGEIVVLPVDLPNWALEVRLVHRRDAAEADGVRILVDNLAAISSGITLGQEF